MKTFSSIFQPGTHETRIAKVLGRPERTGMVERVFDKPLFVLAFTNRSGSTLLGEYLTSVDELTGFAERLNHLSVLKFAQKRGLGSFPAYVQAIGRPAHRAGQSFGVKASWDQLTMLLRYDIHKLFDGLRVIHIVRDDIVAQAVSHSIAFQTKGWSSNHKTIEGVEPEYRFDMIANIINGTMFANQATATITATLGLPYYRVTYEDLLAMPEATVRGIFDWAGVSSEGWSLPVPRLKKQATATNSDFKARFAAEFATKLSGAG